MNNRIVNLKTARKQKARVAKRAAGTSNSAKHGRTKAERATADLEQTRAEAALDGHRLDNEHPGDEW
ncbi:MAG: DUF4169 family protein [Pseudomonadota bacterium]